MGRLESQSLPSRSNRRDFLKTSAVATAGAAAIGGLALSRSAHAAGSDVIRIGVIGCGNRGPGAVINALTVDPGLRLVAMGDIFADHLQNRREMLKKEKPEQVQVDDAHCFVGLDSYKHVIDSCDVVLIALAAKYHSFYLRAAVEAGKHVFVEKPHAIDPVGVREIRAAGELAKQKNVCILSGLQSRFHPLFQEGVQRIHDGQIGEVIAIEEHFERGPYNMVARNPALNEVEFQFSNQMHFTWLSGDDVCQSLAHNIDRSLWVMKEQLPAKCHGMGGRSASFGEIYGNVFDHDAVLYEYPNGVRIYAYCRTQNGCYGNGESFVFGSKGTCYLSRGVIEGQNPWKFSGTIGNPYDLEHKAFFEAIRAGKPFNCADYMANSASATVMGQLACYSGRELTTEQIANSNFAYLPKPEDVRLDMEPPVKPDAQGWYAVPMPGITEFAI